MKKTQRQWPAKTQLALCQVGHAGVVFGKRIVVASINGNSAAGRGTRTRKWTQHYPNGLCVVGLVLFVSVARVHLA